MTETYDATWYDAKMCDPDSSAMLPLETSPWLPMYEQLAALIAPHDEVVDLGCGTGRLLALLIQNEHYANLTGVDWSPAVLEEAARYTNDVPEFLLADLNEWEPDPDRAGNTVFVCSEVLEHLDDDLSLVRRIPPGHRLLLTVPNFSSASHVRVFTSVGDLWDRYAGLLEFRSWRMTGTDRHGIHIAETVRRSDAW